jgi:hypothetical protein
MLLLALKMVLHVVQNRAYQIEFLGSPVLIGLLLFDNEPALISWDLLHVAGLDASKNGGPAMSTSMQEPSMLG